MRASESSPHSVGKVILKPDTETGERCSASAASRRGAPDGQYVAACLHPGCGPAAARAGRSAPQGVMLLPLPLHSSPLSVSVPISVSLSPLNGQSPLKRAFFPSDFSRLAHQNFQVLHERSTSLFVFIEGPRGRITTYKAVGSRFHQYPGCSSV